MQITGTAAEEICDVFGMVPGSGRKVTYTEADDYCIVQAEIATPRTKVRLIHFYGGEQRMVRIQDGVRTRVTVDRDNCVSAIPLTTLVNPAIVANEVRARGNAILREVAHVIPRERPAFRISGHQKLIEGPKGE